MLHTNLGRAPLAEEAARAAYEAARGYLNLELDLETGKRSSRQDAIREWVCRLTGAESATAVNNNAAATVIVLRALCQGKEVIVSRGQLIEIGGSFRIPEIMAVSGAVLREVGTTNITRLADYERAIGPNTGALMQIHTSNYRVSGFTKSVALADLVALGKKHGLPVIDDVGSGALLDFARFGFTGEPLAAREHRGGGRPGAVQRRQAARRAAGGHHRRPEGVDPEDRERPADAGLPPRQDDAGGPGGDAAAVPERGSGAARGAGAADAGGRRWRSCAGGPRRWRSGCGRRRADGGGRAEDVAFVGGGSLPDQAMKTWVVEVEAAGVSDAELAHRLRTGSRR